MTEFFRQVTLPAVREEAHSGFAPSPQLRRALADGGRWLDKADRACLNAWIDAHPGVRTVLEFRTKLGVLLEQRKINVQSKAFSRWVADAERSGIDSLSAFATGLAAGVKTGKIKRESGAHAGVA
jgi:stearoyl-CoA desaturase (delta-9 desaturase)